ncbi:3TM-type holin [Moritella dasanensis]|uniref:3TM-type holin n=1 Tax=Moritella dasanensis TaxID=428031 RepID=UPI0002F35A55|nr:3TM-type holin [Moritella dasanensis]
MSFWTKLFGGAAAQPIDALGSAVDKIFTNDEERMQAQAVLDKIAQQPAILQTEINKLEAQHRSLFVAGWRPAIGWVCAIGLAFPFILNPLIEWAGGTGPKIPMDQLMELVVALLGLGTLRTFEKLAGRAK